MPEMQDTTYRARVVHYVLMGSELVLIGSVPFALEISHVAMTTGMLLIEGCAVACFVKAARLPRVPEPPHPAEPYSALQESMKQVRESESRAARGSQS